MTLGRRDERGQTCSVPHTPTGITGAPVSAASRAAPVLPISVGLEEGLAPRDGPLGHDHHHLTGPQGPHRRGQGVAARRRSRSTLIWPNSRASWPRTGASKTSFLPSARGLRPARMTVSPTATAIEVAAVVGDHDRRAGAGDVLGAGDVEAGVGVQLRPAERPDQVHRLEPEQLGHAGRRVQVQLGPAPDRGDRGQPGVGVDGVGWPTADSSGRS